MPDDLSDPTAARLAAALNAQAAHAAGHSPVLDGLRGADRRPVDDPITIASTPLHGSRRRPGVAIGAAVVGVAAIAAATIAFTDIGPTSGHGSAAQVKTGGSSATSRPPVTATPVPTPVGSAAGRKQLAAAAAARAAAGDPTLRPGQFLLQKTVAAAGPLIYEGKRGTKFKTIEPPAGAYALDRTWRPADQNDVWTRQQQTVGFPAAGTGKSRWAGVCDDLYQDTQDPPVGSGCGRPGSFDDISPNFVAALPRDPSALYAQLRTYAKGEVDPEKIHNVDALVVMTIDGLLSSDAVPADLASSLIKVLALIPSERVVENVMTYKNRTGFGVQVRHVDGSGRDASVEVSGIILDSTTGAYLGDYTGRPGSAHYSPDDVTVSVVDRVPAGH